MRIIQPLLMSALFSLPSVALAQTLTPPIDNYGWWLPVQASTYAPDIDFGIYLIHAAMLLIFVLWGIFFVFLLIRYRHREGLPATRHETGVFVALLPDLAVMTFEILLIIYYAVPSWSRIKIQSPDPSQSNLVEVVAEQFAWNIHYPGLDGKFGRRDPGLVHFTNPLGLDPGDPAGQDDVFSANELHLPLGKPTLIYLTSKDVIHSFFVPEFRIKQDAVPGMRLPVWVEPNRPGVYEIACAQLCGFGHSLMKGSVIVQGAGEFEAWLQARKAVVKKEEKKEEW